MNDTLLRQWAMLRMIPRHPRRVDAATVHGLLSAQGMHVSLRTVQRDLVSLSEAFPLETDDARPQGWWWRQGAAQLEVPSLDPHTALTLQLVEQHLGRMLPSATVAHLAPWFAAARGVMANTRSVVVGWSDKLRFLPNTLLKVAPAVDADIQRTLFDALIAGRQVEVTYQAISRGSVPKTYPVHPLGLVAMDLVMYLVCTARDYQDPRFLALHRVREARLLEAPVSVPAGYDLDDFISREFGVRVGSAAGEQLVLRVRGLLARFLEETPLAPGQKSEIIDAEWTRITASVPDTEQLRSWLRSLGRDAVVESPAHLRAELVAGLEALRNLYEADQAPGE